MPKRLPQRRRRHTAAFKVECVRVMRERLAAGVTLQRVSEEVEVSPDLLREWGKLVERAPAGMAAAEIFPGHGYRRPYVAAPKPPVPEAALSPEEEVRRLRRENERLRLERDFLKKAAAFFAKESQ